MPFIISIDPKFGRTFGVINVSSFPLRNRYCYIYLPSYLPFIHSHMCV